MPLVRISTKPRSVGERRAIGDAVYTAMRETLNVPESDRFQIITEHSNEEIIYDPGYLGIARTDGVIFIQVFLRRGRTVEMKQAFYRRTAELIHANAGVRPEDVMIVLTENDSPDWSFGNGIAQYV